MHDTPKGVLTLELINSDHVYFVFATTVVLPVDAEILSGLNQFLP